MLSLDFNFRSLAFNICISVPLIFLFWFLTCKQWNSENMSFLSGVFVIDFEVTKAFLTKLNFDCSSKLFSERNFSQKVRDKISELEFDLYITLNFHYKKYVFHYSNFLLYGKFHYWFSHAFRLVKCGCHFICKIV